MANWIADDGALIHYEILGSSPEKETLLLLPGLLGSIRSQWPEFARPLADHYQVVLVDLRGHGRSENRQSNLLPERLQQDLLGLLDHLQLESVHVAGYNLGGYLGLMLHLHDPRRVDTLLMHATKFYWTNQSVAAMRQQLDPDRLSANVPGYANQLALEHGGSHWRALVRRAADLTAYLSDQGLTEGMAGRAQCPVLVSVGDRDELIPLQEAYRLSRVFRQGSLLVLPGVRHPFQSLNLTPLLQMMQTFHSRREDNK
jgi:pimeloyl-ACP methyl ester carboxylesterase